MKNKILLWIFGFLALTLWVNTAIAAQDGKIKITTTTSTIADLTQTITGDKAEVYYIASPNQNIHFIAPTPKDVLKTKKADVFIHGGLDLEIWRGPLLDAVGKKEFISGEKAIDVSKGITLIETPVILSRIQGDVHAFGNPHYSVDPEAAKQMAQNIADGLSSLYPESSSIFQKNANVFKLHLDEKIKNWQQRMSPFAGLPIVSYHNSWVYFLERFHLKSFDFLEPKPGISPPPRHLKELIEKMKDARVKIIIRESFNESGTPGKVAKATGAKVVLLASEPGAIKSDYIGLIEKNISILEEVLKSAGIKQ